MMNGNKIDFVICWVDGNDSEWQKEKSKYTPNKTEDNRTIRYRDWDNLQYWFRGVESFAPWVNRIHFVTWGHIPAWLNTNHPKINIVKHEDYIPQEFLPTFSARPIELNLHRIKGLSEQFVFFNDDMFITKAVKETDYFINKKPRDIAGLDISISPDPNHGTAVYNSTNIINRYFNKKRVFRRNFFKWYNFKYGKALTKTLLLTPWNLFTGFYSEHLPNAFLKSTFETVWDLESELLTKTSSNKFRNKEDVTQYIFKYWQLASGNFIPRGKKGQLYKITDNPIKIKKAIESQKHNMICINDNEEVSDFNLVSKEINNSFNKLLPNKSTFEI